MYIMYNTFILQSSFFLSNKTKLQYYKLIRSVGIEIIKYNSSTKQKKPRKTINLL